jgi:hypothetical protein
VSFFLNVGRWWAGKEKLQLGRAEGEYVCVCIYINIYKKRKGEKEELRVFFLQEREKGRGGSWRRLGGCEEEHKNFFKRRRRRKERATLSGLVSATDSLAPFSLFLVI